MSASILDQIACEAREWAGTPWVHQAALRGQGCDCVGLLRGVLQAVTGEVLPFRCDYPISAPMHWRAPAIEPKLAELCDQRGRRAVRPGAVLVFQPFDGRELGVHVGIVTEGDRFVHAHRPKGRVIVSRLIMTFAEQLHSVWLYRGRPCN